jgi:hypothetical protein
VAGAASGVFDGWPGDVLRTDLPGIAFLFSWDALERHGGELATVALRRSLLETFEELAAGPPRLADREFVIFTGDHTFGASTFYLVHFAPAPPEGVLARFSRRWHALGLHAAERGRGRARDYGLLPCMRYERGGAVLYAHAGADFDLNEGWPEMDIELLPEGWTPDRVALRRGYDEWSAVEGEPRDAPHPPPPSLRPR